MKSGSWCNAIDDAAWSALASFPDSGHEQNMHGYEATHCLNFVACMIYTGTFAKFT